MALLWAMFVVAAAAAAVYGLRSVPAGPDPRRSGPAHEPRRRGHAGPGAEHSDFSEETLPAVLNTPSAWEDR
jgi:hypothetical protein